MKTNVKQPNKRKLVLDNSHLPNHAQPLILPPMGFKSPKPPKLPPPPKPPPMPKFEMPEIPAPQPAPPPPSAANDSVQQAALDQRRQAARRRGYKSTLISQQYTPSGAGKPTLG